MRLQPRSPLPHLLWKPVSVLREVLEHHAVQEDGDRIQVRSESIHPEAQGFERDGTTTSKRIGDETAGALSATKSLVCSARQPSRGVNEIGIEGEIPVREVCDEIE